MLNYCTFRSVFFVVLFGFCLSSLEPGKHNGGQCKRSCYNGVCKNETHCICNPGWTGKNCETCFGRIRLTKASGFVSDGPTNYTTNMRCAWLVDGLPAGAKRIVLKFDSFITECAWDHVFLFDGDGMYSKQLAALSGVLTPSRDISNSEFLASSGQAFIYFFSDLAYNMQGFNISYKINGCPHDCNHHGKCNAKSGKCICNKGWSGDWCQISCQNTCNMNNSYGCINGKCSCLDRFHGPDCNTAIGKSIWSSESDTGPGARASHSAVIYDNFMWIFGGLHFLGAKYANFAKYNFLTSTWSLVDPVISGNCTDSDCVPMIRYDHSMVLYMDKLYMFGGVLEQKNLSSEFWVFDPKTSIWQLLDENHNDFNTKPYHVAGHTAHVIGNVMVVIFGYNQFKGYLNLVQEYHFSNSSWIVPHTVGASVIGAYGHSSVYDKNRGRILVHGGYYSLGTSVGAVSDRLYSYQPHIRTWTILHSSGHQVFRHAAGLLNGIMLVVGGNSHNESTPSRETDCYASKILAYDTECDSWYDVDISARNSYGTGRYGHTIVDYEIEDKTYLYLYGGFNGKILDDTLKFTTGACIYYGDRDSCVSSKQGVKCVWTGKDCRSTQESKEEIIYVDDKHGDVDKHSSDEQQDVVETCQFYGLAKHLKCAELVDCRSCTGPMASGCVWCDGKCTDSDTCQAAKQNIEEKSKCPSEAFVKKSQCYMYDTCYGCKAQPNCRWYIKTKPYGRCIDSSDEITDEESTIEDTSENENEPAPTGMTSTTVREEYCPAPCSDHNDCGNCVQNGCMWCSTMARCVNINSYMPSFPYGSCTEWTSANQGDKACIDPTDCEAQQTCDDCHSVGPRCGWCDDGSGTGLGQCTRGGYSGPVIWDESTHLYEKNMSMCPNSKWYFFGCPACQCNGHGPCTNETAIAGQASVTDLKCEWCDDMTTGDHCQTCVKGYYGNALNGGNCTECQCNGQATECDPYTGECYCTTKGVSGKHCDSCDQKYIGDPKNQTCFYELSVDFIFTFKLDANDKKDKHISKINFVTRPTKKDTDVSFKLTCSGSPAKVNLSVYSGAFEKGWRRFLAGSTCTEIERTFGHEEFQFGTDANTTFFVYLYDFRTPVILQISFAQSPPIDWGKFFLTFASCFILLLFGAALTWRIKMRVDTYRRRQRMFVEMAQMASRPFGSVQLELLPPKNTSYKVVPSALAIEPCGSYKAAVVTVSVRLPTGGRKYAPNGQSGLAVASSLCQLTSNQVSLLQTPNTSEQDQKPKRRRRTPVEAYYGLRNWANTTGLTIG